jgi:hypothetical protein
MLRIADFDAPHGYRLDPADIDDHPGRGCVVKPLTLSLAGEVEDRLTRRERDPVAR